MIRGKTTLLSWIHMIPGRPRGGESMEWLCATLKPGRRAGGGCSVIQHGPPRPAPGVWITPSARRSATWPALLAPLIHGEGCSPRSGLRCCHRTVRSRSCVLRAASSGAVPGRRPLLTTGSLDLSGSKRCGRAGQEVVSWGRRADSLSRPRRGIVRGRAEVWDVEPHMRRDSTPEGVFHVKHESFLDLA